jgi:hypothetical protein
MAFQQQILNYMAEQLDLIFLLEWMMGAQATFLTALISLAGLPHAAPSSPPYLCISTITSRSLS